MANKQSAFYLNFYLFLSIQTPVTVELVDDILGFLTEVNVKKINAETFDSKNFVDLLNKMIALCLALIQHRSVFVLDRVPQFSNVFKDLLQTICWYKSNRSHQLDQAEVTMLAEMAHHLEKFVEIKTVRACGHSK